MPSPSRVSEARDDGATRLREASGGEGWLDDAGRLDPVSTYLTIYEGTARTWDEADLPAALAPTAFEDAVDRAADAHDHWLGADTDCTNAPCVLAVRAPVDRDSPDPLVLQFCCDPEIDGLTGLTGGAPLLLDDGTAVFPRWPDVCDERAWARECSKRARDLAWRLADEAEVLPTP